jgi:hypothetical protein
MIETIPGLTQAQRQAQRMHHAVRVEAMRRARKEVKARLGREGKVRLSDVAPRDITEMAEAYVSLIAS